MRGLQHTRPNGRGKENTRQIRGVHENARHTKTIYAIRFLFSYGASDVRSDVTRRHNDQHWRRPTSDLSMVQCLGCWVFGRFTGHNDRNACGAEDRRSSGCGV